MGEKHRIGVLSDTHGLLRPEVLEHLRGCEAILHGGDINRQEILDRLEEIAPVYVVRGNNDKEWAEKIPETLRLEFYGVKIFMIHNKKQIPKNLSCQVPEGKLRGEVLFGDVDVVIYGHSHRYEEKCERGMLWLNPGSCGPRRFSQPVTMAVLEIDEAGSVCVKRYDIPHKAADNVTKETGGSGKATAGNATKETGGSGKATVGNATKETGGSGKATAGNVTKETGAFRKASAGETGDLRRIIETVIKETKKGRSVQDMARKLQISEELAEQICRLYLTHPGVDADGIMTKMGL